MNHFMVWQYATWAIIAIIIIACLVIVLGMYRESQNNKNRDIAAPVINPSGTEKKESRKVFDSADDTSLAENQSRRSRRGRRSKETPVAPVEATDASNFFGDDDDDFTITSGRD